MKKIKVAAAIIKDGQKILIAQRLSGEFAGMWEFPGGKIEESETSKQALSREIKEELELNITVDEFLITAEYDYAQFHLSMDCYICTRVEGSIVLNEHSEIRWIHLHSDFKKIDWVPADVQVIKALQNRFKADID